jgi:hypothetical protein
MAIHDWLFHKRTWNNLLFLLCLFLFFGFTFPPASFLFFYPPCLPSFKYISPLGCKPLEGKGILLTPSLQCWASSCQCSPNSAECEHQATFLPFLPSRKSKGRWGGLECDWRGWGNGRGLGKGPNPSSKFGALHPTASWTPLFGPSAITK